MESNEKTKLLNDKRAEGQSDSSLNPNVGSAKDLPETQKSIRHTSSSMLVLEEMEDAKAVTAPLIFSVIIVSLSMFSVGHNTSVMNAPEKMVFPGYIVSWRADTANQNTNMTPLNYFLPSFWDTQNKRKILESC